MADSIFRTDVSAAEESKEMEVTCHAGREARKSDLLCERVVGLTLSIHMVNDKRAPSVPDRF